MKSETQLREEAEQHLSRLKQLADADWYSAPGKAFPVLGSLLTCLSDIYEISTRRLIRQTDKLICLTWALVIFSAALLVLTFVLVERH
jgi:hypothetical protein